MSCNRQCLCVFSVMKSQASFLNHPSSQVIDRHESADVAPFIFLFTFLCLFSPSVSFSSAAACSQHSNIRPDREA